MDEPLLSDGTQLPPILYLRLAEFRAIAGSLIQEFSVLRQEAARLREEAAECRILRDYELCALRLAQSQKLLSEAQQLFSPYTGCRESRSSPPRDGSRSPS